MNKNYTLLLSVLIATASNAMSLKEDPRAEIQTDLARADIDITKLYEAINHDIQSLTPPLTDKHVLNCITTRVGSYNQSEQQSIQWRYCMLFEPITKVIFKTGRVDNYYMNNNGTQVGILEEEEGSSLKVLNVWEKLKSRWEKRRIVALYAQNMWLKWEMNNEKKSLLTAEIYRSPDSWDFNTIDLTADLERAGCSFENTWDGHLWCRANDRWSSYTYRGNTIIVDPSKKHVCIQHIPTLAEIAKYLCSEALKGQSEVKQS